VLNDLNALHTWNNEACITHVGRSTAAASATTRATSTVRSFPTFAGDSLHFLLGTVGEVARVGVVSHSERLEVFDLSSFGV